ncbi:MAG: hypothetical protein JJ863_02540 [Deltaproteobacteria bacterium]|nr:hypothetical protein [Deltaproteobacteria bacterium]
MATYNFHRAEITCPWCYRAHTFQLQFKLGRGGLNDYAVGDRIEYVGLAPVHEGGRPPNGDWDAEGHGECPSCERDFFVDLAVRGDVLVGADRTSVRKAFMAGDLGSPWGRPAREAAPLLHPRGMRTRTGWAPTTSTTPRSPARGATRPIGSSSSSVSDTAT